MPEILVHFRHDRDIAGGRPISCSSFLIFSEDGRSVVKTNLKINVSMDFDAARTSDLLERFFGRAAYASRIKREPNQKGMIVDFHGDVQRVDLNELIVRKGSNAGFRHDVNDYELLEVGVNINLFRPKGAVYNYDKNNNNSIEIKFNKQGDPNFRLVVNIHFSHEPRKNNVANGIRELDELASLFYSDHDVVQEIAFCKSVNIFDYRQYGYKLADNSADYYPMIASLHAGTRIVTLEQSLFNEAAARQAVEVNLTAEVAARIAAEDRLSSEIQTRENLSAKVDALEALIQQLKSNLEQQAAATQSTYAPTLFGCFK